MIESRSPQVEAFWANFCQAKEIPAGTTYHARTFSDAALSTKTDEIAELARLGQKRGTAHLDLDFEQNGVPRRQIGDHWVILNSALEPLCVVRVTGVAVTPFNEVAPEFNASEGEGDLSLDYWATVHKRYFVKQLESWCMAWQDKLPVVCESFELVYPT